MNIAFFISSHGFGHAARACAIMEKISKKYDVKFTIFSSTPEWFFNKSLQISYDYVEMQTDVGLIQNSPFEEDLQETLIALEKFYPIRSEFSESVKKALIKKGIEVVFCDISPLGMIVSSELGIPAILIENFTWEWIYEKYIEEYPAFRLYIDYLNDVNKYATLHFSCEPYCINYPDSIKIAPVFRETRIEGLEIRNQLNVKEDEVLVLITMGGIPINQINIQRNMESSHIKFLIPTTKNCKDNSGNFIFLPHNHSFFHPDLVKASDIIIGKLGYSTIAEVISLNKPFLFVKRESFRESKVLERYVRENIISNSIEYDRLFDIENIKKILTISNSKLDRNLINGADQVSEFFGNYFRIN